MSLAKTLLVFVFMGCVEVSLQRCFSDHCSHHATLKECMNGHWTCQHGEYCEVTTHVAHGNSPWVVMNCRPHHTLSDCQATHNSNSPLCDINNHDRVCHWCCDTADCLRNLANGVTQTNAPATTAPPAVTTAPPAVTTAPPAVTTAPPAATTAPPAVTTAPPAVTTAPPAATTAPPAVTTAPPAVTTAPPAVTTAPPAATTAPPAITTANTCTDVYRGDCAADFAGRCGDVLVQQLCALTCNTC